MSVTARASEVRAVVPSPVRRLFVFRKHVVRGGGTVANDLGSVLLRFTREDVVVDLRLVLLVERAGDHVESRRDTTRGHGGERQGDIAGRLRILPLRRVDIAVEDLLRRVERVAPADDRDLARLDA